MKTIADARLDQHHRAAVQAAAELLRRRFDAAHIILFGSTARGEAGPDSDIDLLVLLPRPVTFAERLAVSEALSPLGRSHGVLFNTVVAPASSWPNQPFPLCRAIHRDGVAA